MHAACDAILSGGHIAKWFIMHLIACNMNEANEHTPAMHKHTDSGGVSAVAAAAAAETVISPRNIFGAVTGNNDEPSDEANTTDSDDDTTIMTAILALKWSMCFYVNASTDFDTHEHAHQFARLNVLGIGCC